MASESVKNETVKDPQVLVKSKYPIAELLKEEGKTQIIIEGNLNWFRLVKRGPRKKDEVLLIDGNTNQRKFKTDSESYLANYK